MQGQQIITELITKSEAYKMKLDIIMEKIISSENMKNSKYSSELGCLIFEINKIIDSIVENMRKYEKELKTEKYNEYKNFCFSMRNYIVFASVGAGVHRGLKHKELVNICGGCLGSL